MARQEASPRAAALAASRSGGHICVGIRCWQPAATQAAPVQRHALHQRVHARANGEAHALDRITCQSREQRVAAAIEPDLDGRRFAGRHFDDDGGEHVERAHVRGRGLGQHHVAGVHAQPEPRARRHIEPWQPPQPRGRAQLGEVESGIVTLDRGLDDGAGLGFSGQRDQVEPVEDARRRPHGGNLAVGEQHDRGSQPGDLGNGVADIDDRHPAFIAQALDVGQDLGLARLVEGRQRLVHQQQAGVGEQRPADGDALLLPAREPPRPPLQQTGDAQQIDHALEIVAPLGGRREPAAVQQVLSHGQMREQAAFLEHVADAALVSRHEDAARRIDEACAVDEHRALLGTNEPGDDIDQRCLARPGAAEQCGEAATRLEARFEAEAAEGVPDVDRERHSISSRRLAERAISSEASSASMAIATDTAVRRSAPRSPPGTCVKV